MQELTRIQEIWPNPNPDSHEGVAIPVIWWMLDKRGNSNTTERILLLEEFRDWFPDVKIAAITADRECNCSTGGS